MCTRASCFNSRPIDLASTLSTAEIPRLKARSAAFWTFFGAERGLELLDEALALDPYLPV